jgi:hypothetical protein
MSTEEDYAADRASRQQRADSRHVVLGSGGRRDIRPEPDHQKLGGTVSEAIRSLHRRIAFSE